MSQSSPTHRAEQLLAIAIAVVTLSGTLITYASVKVAGAASGADNAAVSETLALAGNEISSDIQARFSQGLDGRLRTKLAEANAIGTSNPSQANQDRLTAQRFAVQGGLAADDLTKDFDYDSIFEQNRRSFDTTSIPQDQPAQTAERADRDHTRTRWLALDILGLLAVVVLLTLARLTRVERDRRAISGVAGILYGGLIVFAAVQVW